MSDYKPKFTNNYSTPAVHTHAATGGAVDLANIGASAARAPQAVPAGQYTVTVTSARAVQSKNNAVSIVLTATAEGVDAPLSVRPMCVYAAAGESSMTLRNIENLRALAGFDPAEAVSLDKVLPALTGQTRIVILAVAAGRDGVAVNDIVAVAF